MANLLIFLQINVFTLYVLLPIKCVYYSETCVLSHIRLFEILWTVACQAFLSMGFCRQEYWSGLPLLTPEDIPDPGIKPASPDNPALEGGFFTTGPPGKSRGRLLIVSEIMKQLG